MSVLQGDPPKRRQEGRQKKLKMATEEDVSKGQRVSSYNLKKLKVLQVNLNRAWRAHDMANLTARKENIDIIMASEPNRTIVKRPGWIADKRSDTAIYFLNKSVQVEEVKKQQGYVRLKLKSMWIYCCYVSPNIDIGQYTEYINTLMADISSCPGEKIILGDLNAKSAEWGSPVTDNRGVILEEWLAELDMVVLNDGITPTFRRGTSSSFIDVTFSTQRIAKRIKNWRVMEDESLSDHNHIYFEIQGAGTKPVEKRTYHINREVLRLELVNKSLSTEEADKVSTGMKIISEAYRKSKTRANQGEENLLPYWWCPEIKMKRQDCIKARRNFTRIRRGNSYTEEDIERLKEELRIKRKQLKDLIGAEKRKHWNQLCRDLDDNIWGNGYKVAVKYLTNLSPPYSLAPERRMEIVSHLFPNRTDSWSEGTLVEGVTPFTLVELRDAGQRIKEGKAPGPDGIPPGVIKEAIHVAPDMLMSMMNEQLQKQQFPRQWKLAKVILLWKSGRSIDSPTAYRPICLLDVMGKLYEALIQRRLEIELERGEGLSEAQFGFRRGRSTIQAAELVAKMAKNSERRLCVLVTLDVKNAFNSAVWSIIIRELRRRGVAKYLVNIICSYFTDRKIKVTGKDIIDVTVGVPQGSVLGPTLWNILYDGILRQDLGEGVKAIGYADDLAVVITADEADTLERVTNEALRRINVWMRGHHLELAPEKTEIVILKGKRRCRNVVFEIQGLQIAAKKAIKYLGIVFDDQFSFGEHIKETVAKAERSTSALARLLPNVGGPRSRKRVVLNGVTQSVLLYGAPVWYTAMRIKKYAEMLERTQRKMLLRIASAYRTTSTISLQVITGIAPIELQVEERRFIHEQREGHLPEIWEAAKRIKREMWQRKWNENVNKAQWTKKLIPQLDPWLNCNHRDLDYHLTQVLTGHGHFHTYTKRMNLSADDMCFYCGETDTVEHTVFVCNRWVKYRQDTYTLLGEEINPDNMVQKMIESSANWKLVQKLVKRIMTQKEKDERRTIG